MPWLINAVQLEKFRKNQKNLLIFDASWYLPVQNRNAKNEFISEHIIGARFLDLDLFNDNTTTLPNMLIQDEKKASEIMGNFGITPEHKIIFYDNSDLHTSCRAAFIFKTFGHQSNSLYILDGGLEAWKRFGGKIETGETKSLSAKKYQATFHPEYIRTLTQMKHNIQKPSEQVIDLRHPVRYAGGPELRPALRTGHIPGSFSFPYFTMFETNGTFKPIEKIKKQLYGLGVDFEIPIITTCGSGITSTILNFLLDIMGFQNNALYDGSWSEWGADHLYPNEENLNERPVETCLGS